MDFSISIEQESIIESVNKFLSKNITPLEQIEYDKKGTAPYHLMEGMAELGLFGMPFPEKYGGSNVGWDTIALIQEHMGKKAYMAASLLNRTIGFGGMSILKFGNTDQKSQIIPEIIKGKILFSLALSETGAGSDAAAIVTQAKRASNDTWSIKGNKIWVSDAAESKYMVVACRTDMKTSGASGITLFLVKPSTPGVIITPMRKIGTNWMPSYDVNFDEVIVSDKNMLGDENGGFKHLMTILHFARAGMAASVSGLAQRAVDIALNHSKERYQFGKPLAANQVISHRLADMQMRVDQSKLMAWYLAWMIKENKDCRRYAAEAKVIATETLNFVTDAGMQILAGAGYDLDTEMQRIWKDGRLYTFGEGTNEIQRNIIAKEIIG
tara:strand:+ start:108 stop:1253 length:1146 start_codon:yes stop_codon:yes gene_type:complete